MRNSSLLKTSALVILLALAGWWLYSNIEFYEEQQDSEWSLEALRNPFLAAQRFMQKGGVEVIDVDSLVKIDQLEGIGTLFFSDANQVQSPRQLRQVMSWLQQGGHVIYTADSVAHADDLLLKEFKVDVRWRDPEEEQEAQGKDKSLGETMREYNRQIEEGKTREEIAEALQGEDESLTQVKFGEGIGNLEIEFDTDKNLQHPHITDSEYEDSGHQPFSWSYSDAGVQMMQFDVGDGLLTIISDSEIWTSYRIDRADNAYLLWLLSSGEGNFAFLRSVVRDSIWVLIGQSSRELLIACALLTLFWIWHLGHRFGRLLPRDLSRTRALAEHFTSISHYLWHRRHGVYLITALRQRVLRRASLVLGEFAAAEESRQFELLARRCDINVDSIEATFLDSDFNETTFVQTVRLLKRIEQSL